MSLRPTQLLQHSRENFRTSTMLLWLLNRNAKTTSYAPFWGAITEPPWRAEPTISRQAGRLFSMGRTLA